MWLAVRRPATLWLATGPLQLMDLAQRLIDVPTMWFGCSAVVWVLGAATQGMPVDGHGTALTAGSEPLGARSSARRPGKPRFEDTALPAPRAGSGR